MSMRRPSIIGHHLIFTGYGHWLPNDLRGSGSTEIRKSDLRELGDIHHGRKRVQPSRRDLRAFHRNAEPLLQYPVLWFDDAMRRAIADAFGEVIRSHGYTCWAFAACGNHAHTIIRVHRDKGDLIWRNFATETRDLLQQRELITPNHPLWSQRPYAVFLTSPQRVRSCIEYVLRNPAKEGLDQQEWNFVQSYNNWPFHKPR